MRELSNLLELGIEQLHFLSDSLMTFERGKLFEVKRIASVIRTLVHDTDLSNSLIGQIENHPDNTTGKSMTFFDRGGIPDSLKDGLVAYIDCRIPRIKANISKEVYLDTFRVTCDTQKWWNRIVLSNPISNKKIWSRRDLALKYANKDGGNHVDSELPVDLISAQNSYTYVGDNYEFGIGYIVMLEAGVTMLHSFNNYIEFIKA